jgi:death-on-curing protein
MIRLRRTRSWGASLPSDRVRFLSLDEVLAIHERAIEEFGGASGVRDLGLLESALYRPQSGYYEDLVTMAAALFESLLMNHPFVDGNKRVAFFATDVFLRLNGFRLDVDANETYDWLTELFNTGRCDLAHISAWIRQSVTT